MTGTVKFFNAGKGFGFIVPDDPGPTNGRDIFVSHRHIKMVGFRTLSPKMRVEFDLELGERGPQATDVTLVG